MKNQRRSSAPRSGFTLAEVAVTIVIVGTMLVYLLQGLNGTKLLAAHTRNIKLARELALTKLGQIGAGEFQEDIEHGLNGSFADEGYPDFTFEVVVGDETFREQQDPANPRFDSWNPPDSNKDETTDKDKDTEVDKPFEKIKLKISFPRMQEFKNELILEEWFPWEQVYGKKEDSKKEGQTTDPASGQTPGSGSAGGSSSTTPKTKP
jgi:prepilin-type N-terminal cleavage/methylation domain-containing protein